jgi:hypothetical protein
MARRFVSGLEFTGMSQANRCRERWRDLALGSLSARAWGGCAVNNLPSCEAVCLLFALQSFLVQNFALSRGCSRPSTQEFATAMNDHVASAAPAPPKSRRFCNWKLIGGEIILTVLGVYLFVAQVPRLSGMAGLVVGVLGVWLLLSEFRGFAVAPNPTSRIRSWKSGFYDFSGFVSR